MRGLCTHVQLVAMFNLWLFFMWTSYRGGQEAWLFPRYKTLYLTSWGVFLFLRTGGNGHALLHFKKTGHPLVCKVKAINFDYAGNCTVVFLLFSSSMRLFTPSFHLYLFHLSRRCLLLWMWGFYQRLLVIWAFSPFWYWYVFITKDRDEFRRFVYLFFITRFYVFILAVLRSLIFYMIEIDERAKAPLREQIRNNSNFILIPAPPRRQRGITKQE